VRALWTGLALAAALLAETALSHIAPAQARLFDPFLLVLVYCGLLGGETHGMLAGMAAGWVQDVHFGGPVAGLAGLTKIVVGFGVGAAASRFLLTGASSRMLVLFVAGLVDTLLFERLAFVFDVGAQPLSFGTVLGRVTLNALVGGLVFELLDRRRLREAHR
jgi:rod shape-determining protein MreD